MENKKTPLLVRQTVPLHAYRPRLYLNGFPKAGLHLLERLVEPLLSKDVIGHTGNEWLGSFKWYSWSNEWMDKRPMLWRMSCLERGKYIKGHMGYDEDVEALMWLANIGQIFICRDLRDVAVSHAHHVWDEDKPNLEHAHKDVYRMLGNFDDVLTACIQGMGPYPGVFDRWEQYAPWLKVEWVMKLRYEDVIKNTRDTAGSIVMYAIKNATHLLEGNLHGVDCTEETYNALVDMMVNSAMDTSQSTTFRRGKVGGWRDEFKPHHVQLIKELDVNNWLVRLGYEKDKEWTHESPSEDRPPEV